MTAASWTHWSQAQASRFPEPAVEPWPMPVRLAVGVALSASSWLVLASMLRLA